MQEIRIHTEKKTDLKEIFKLSWPVMLGMILQSLLGTVDMMFISHLGTDALAAASMGISAAGVIFVLSTLVSAGTTALVARSFGEGDPLAVKKFSSESILLSAIIGGLLSMLCYIYTIPIVRLMFNPEPQMVDITNQYLSIIFLGTFLVFLNSALRTILQALGDTRTPLYIFGLSNLLNMALAPLLIFVLGMGIRGAAWAMVLSTLFSFIGINIVLIRKIYDASITSFIESFGLCDVNSSLRILKIGAWACIQNVARPITGLLMMRLVYQVGNSAGTAAFGAGGQLFNYTFIFLIGLSTAISIMVGQSLGRKDIHACDVIIKEGMKLAMINMILFAIPYFVFPEWIIKIFTKDPVVIKIGVDYLRIVYIGVIFVIFPTIYGGVFQGAGDTFPPMLASLIANVVFKLPLAYLLAGPLKMGSNGVWAAIALSIVIEAGIIIFYFKQNKWKEKVI